MFQVSSGSFDIEFYNEFIAREIVNDGSIGAELFENAFKLDTLIHYYAIQLPTNSPVHYNEVLFCDIYTEPNGYYYPVFITMINSSSAYAMCRCGMDYDDDSDDGLEWSVDDTTERVSPYWKDVVKEFLM